MKKLILLFALVFGISTMATSCKEHKHEKDEETEVRHSENHAAEKADIAMNNKYVCPMDCEEGKSYDEEGTCPVCKMALQKEEKEHEEEHDSGESHEHDDGEEHEH